jgi:hypothetical protein
MGRFKRSLYAFSAAFWAFIWALSVSSADTPSPGVWATATIHKENITHTIPKRLKKKAGIAEGIIPQKYAKWLTFVSCSDCISISLFAGRPVIIATFISAHNCNTAATW